MTTTIPAGWKPIESAPKNQLVMVYTPPQPNDWPDSVRIGFDYIDPEIADDYWYNHGEHYEHYCCVAKPENCTGPQECAPYTHWMPLPAAPASPVSTVEDAVDEQTAFERWYDRTCPSGDVEAVQRQWEASSDYADFHAPAAGDALTDAARDVLAERQRQQEKEGFNDENDDNYCGDLAAAGAAYALNAAENISAFRESNENDASPECWPWPNRWWKPTMPRRDLVKACALILAEIERLDRAAQRQGDA